ncbi:MAG: polysaccharide pyruvyl transferase family protein, partial [Nitrospiraceae bacterium]
MPFVSLAFPSLVGRVFSRNAGYAALLSADLVICNGGILFFWDKVNRRPLHYLFKLMYPFLLARRAGVQYGFYAQTLGPFVGVGRSLFRWFFSGSKFILTRENISKCEVEGLGIDPSLVAVVADTAFALAPGDGAEVVLANN